MARVILLSDLHLSPTHGFFWENWRIARNTCNAARPDLVVITGDLCINGPDSDDEIKFAASALRGLSVPHHALPGNHDVGDEPPGQDAKQLIDPVRLARWNAAFGGDRFAVTLGAWRLVGVNAQLFGSGLPQETEQTEWLAAELAATAVPVALFLHKPLFLNDPEAETIASTSSITPAPRGKLLDLLRTSTVQLVISGHLHSYRDVRRDGIRYIWAPAMSFIHAAHHSAEPMVAAMSLDFSRTTPAIELLRWPALEAPDLAVIKGHGRYPFLRGMPPCPPPPDDLKEMALPRG